jgi:hypothetical protein
VRPRPCPRTPCSCHYEGELLDGTVFDSSYKRGKPITFAPRQVIKGWTEVSAGARLEAHGVGCRVQGAGCRVQGAGCTMQGAQCRVHNAGYTMQGAQCRV